MSLYYDSNKTGQQVDEALDRIKTFGVNVNKTPTDWFDAIEVDGVVYKLVSTATPQKGYLFKHTFYYNRPNIPANFTCVVITKRNVRYNNIVEALIDPDRLTMKILGADVLYYNVATATYYTAIGSTASALTVNTDMVCNYTENISVY